MDTNHSSDSLALRFESVDFSYGTLSVLRDATFHIHRGEFIALVGPNGAGKTTALKLALGLEQPTRGRVEIFGLAPRDARDRLGYVPQHALYDPTFPISVREVVRMGRLRVTARSYGATDVQAVEDAMNQAEIGDLSRRAYSTLSGGQRRRVLVARALAAKPDLLILDEPTANMDAESEERLFKTLGELKGNATILIVTHDTGFVSSLTDRVLCVGEHGRRGDGNGIVQHRTAPTENAPPELFGGEAFKVLHEEQLPGDSCCCKEHDE